MRDKRVQAAIAWALNELRIQPINVVSDMKMNWTLLKLSAFTAISVVTAPMANAAVIGQLGILDDTANGGINPVTSAAWAPGDQYRLVFVSSTFRDATSYNIADYNAHVQAAADGAGLGGATWNAIASTKAPPGGGSVVDARDNTGTNSTIDPVGTSIFLIDGTTKIADSYTDLWDGSIDSQINRTETNSGYNPPNSSPFGQFGGVWAGTSPDGTNRGNAALGGTSSGDLGLAIATNSQWIRRAAINGRNDEPLGFYAMSEVLTIPPIPEPSMPLTLAFGLLGFILRRRR